MSVSRQMQQQETMSRFISTVRHDKRTTFMDPKEEAYWMHFLSRDPLVGDYIRSQMQVNPKLRREVMNQPVCERCEGFTFFHKGGAQCSACGHWSKDQTHTLKKHIREGYYR